MAQTYPQPSDDRRAGFRVISSEDAPPYDTGAQGPKRHVTVIEDDAIEAIAAQCGFAALGLYTVMERRANADQFAFGSYQDWADMAGMTRRHVIRLMDQLTAGGWVEKHERTTINGMTRSNAWRLPYHRKPRTDGGDTTSDIPSDTTSDIGGGVYVTPKVVEVVRSSTEVVTPPAPSTPKAKRTLPENGTAQQIVAAYCLVARIEQPANYRKAVGQAAMLAKAGITPEDIPDLYEYVAQWAGGADLGLLVNQADRWRANKAAPVKSNGKVLYGQDGTPMPPEIAERVWNNAVRMKWENDHRRATS